ncbi:MAG: flagellar biosynthetic protein FliO [Rhodocyclales bacterium]|nr:flagellar biosynthetic protein FliO [Rhodocyclales bacterium]
MATMFQTFAMLALLLALFVGAAWLMKRLNDGRGPAHGQGPLRIVSTLSLGPRERILLVEIEDTWLVVGVSSGQMRTLHTLPKGSLPQAAAAGHGQFGQFNQWLRHFRNAPHDAKE